MFQSKSLDYRFYLYKIQTIRIIAGGAGKMNNQLNHIFHGNFYLYVKNHTQTHTIYLVNYI